MKPEYRFKCIIEDETTGETVIAASTFVSQIDREGGCESVELELYSMLRAFQRSVRASYESKHY